MAGLFILFFSVNGMLVAEPESKVAKLEATIETTPEAKAVVLTFQKKLLSVMEQGEALGFKGRYDTLEPAILKSHDLARVARIVVGKVWKGFSDVQKKTFVDVFSRFSIASYAHNFKESSGEESFEYEAEEKTARGGVIVHSTFMLPNNKKVKFDYMLKNKSGEWLIINVIANGVSDLALKRSEYTSILEREGFDALIAKITEKIDNYTNQ
ncbi:MAG: ABC transporter substrate-binding protein [Methylococcales bacterium]|nr:ABC transporter substrate-binding protein [Methylococcales bacterium]